MHNASTGPGNRSLIQGWKGGKIAPTALCTMGATQVAKTLSSADRRPCKAEEPSGERNQEEEKARTELGNLLPPPSLPHPPLPHKIASSSSFSFSSTSSFSSSSCSSCSPSSEEDRISLHLPLGFLFICSLPS